MKKALSTYPRLFKDLGELVGVFSIKLKPGSTHFAQRMEKLGVIYKVTDWCAGTEVIPKPDGRIRICVHLTKLNESVLGETYPLLKIENLCANSNQ